jgi:carboxyl-terminal processing protease
MTKRRILSVLIVLVVAAALLGSGFLLGFKSGRKFPENIVVKGVQNVDGGMPGNVNFGVFWQAWQMINDNYLKNEGVSNSDKLYGAIGGLVNSLGDPYSEFFNPKDNKKFYEDVQGNFGGIGAELGMKDGQLVIIAPLKGTPASRAGLLAGDKILAINSSSTEGISIDNAVSLIRGQEGTTVTLTIMRNGWQKSKDFKITRANIVVPTIDAETVDDNILRLELHSFNANAEYLFYQAMFKALSGGSRGMILDLRNNPGGYLEVAVDLAGWFLPRGSLVVSEEGRVRPKTEFRANGNAALANFPVVVLINKGSASAAEILAGALRDDRGIKLVGETSFGKGTVQELEPLPDGSAIKLTVAHWVLPSGGILENGGLVPDFEVKMTDDDVANHRDPQLDKAIEVLRSEIIHK